MFDISSDRDPQLAKTILKNMKELASGMTKSKLYSKADIKIAVAFGNNVANFDGNKPNVKRLIDRVSLSDAQNKLDTILPLSLVKMASRADATRKSIVLFTDSTDYMNLKDPLMTVKDKGYKLIPVLFTKKAIDGSEDDNDVDVTICIIV